MWSNFCCIALLCHTVQNTLTNVTKGTDSSLKPLPVFSDNNKGPNMSPLDVQTNTTQLRSYCYYVFNFFIWHFYPWSKFCVDAFHIPEIHSYTVLLFQVGHICCMCFVRSLRAAVLRQQCSVLPQAEPRPVSDRLPGAFCLWATHAVQQALYGKTLPHERTHIVSYLCTVPCSQWFSWF